MRESFVKVHFVEGRAMNVEIENPQHMSLGVFESALNKVYTAISEQKASYVKKTERIKALAEKKRVVNAG